MGKGWVYILINPSLQKNLLKIGKTEVSPQERAKQLSSTGVPTEFHVAYDVQVEDCHTAEKLIHDELEQYRYKRDREFFNIPLKQAIPIVENIASKAGKVETKIEEKKEEKLISKVSMLYEENGNIEQVNIFQKFLNVLKGHEGETFTRSEILNLIIEKYPGTNTRSLIPSDYCYNITNKGIPFQNHIFEQIEVGRYKYLGINYKYSGYIYWSKQSEPVGEWKDGVLVKAPTINR